MKNFHLSFVLASILSIVLVACGEKAVEVASVSISQPSAEMEIGETLSLKATVSPSNASYDAITWTSAKPQVASVSASGLVSAISEGNTTITVTAGGKAASCSVTVVKGFVAVSAISLNKTSLELVEDDTETLTATVSPDDATDKTVSWTSSNEAVANVKDGTITAIKEGNADKYKSQTDPQAVGAERTACSYQRNTCAGECPDEFIQSADKIVDGKAHCGNQYRADNGNDDNHSGSMKNEVNNHEED